MKTLWLLAMLVSGIGAATSPVYYVAADGDDNSPGTLEAPFATVHRARDAVRRHIVRGLTSDVTVLLREGVYYMDAPFSLGPEDSGTAEHSITYAAYPGETPVLSGGRAVTHWQEIGEGRWTASVLEKGPFRQLFRNDKRLPRGRFPDGDALLRVTAVNDDVTVITLDAEPPAIDYAAGNVELVVYQNWSITRMPVVSGANATVQVSHPAGWIGHGPMTTTSPGKPAYLEHAAAFVTTPGEWHLDYRHGILTYYAEEGEDPNTAQFVAPKLERLLVMRGDRDNPVRNLHFEGLTFAHARWTLPEFGYAGIQAGHHGTTMEAPTHVLPGALELVHVADARFEDCRVAHVGASGIVLGAGCRDNSIVDCTLEDIGGTGIMVGWRGEALPKWDGLAGNYSLSADWREKEDIPKNNAVIGCIVRRCAAVNRGCVGIYDAFCDSTRISRNRVYDMPYTGISIGFRWDEAETTQRNCLVEYNHVHNVMQILADGGAIYTLGYQPGAVLRGNVLYDVHRSDFAHGGAPNNGIFFDQGSKGYRVEENIIYNTSGEAIRFNQTGPDNMAFVNNAFGIDPGHPDFPSEAAALIKRDAGSTDGL